jgi:hypothetical protein
MMRNIFILVSILSYSILIYFPLNKKEIGLNNDDLCHYIENNDKVYVKACNEGYYCKSIEEKNIKYGICLEYNPIVKDYKEKCKEDTECNPDLKCINNICLKGNDEPYKYEDKVSKKLIYYCNDDDKIPTTPNKCEKITPSETAEDKCFLSYDFLKVCGELNDDQSYSNSYFGTVEDNKIVRDVLACKSGFTLFFFNDGKTQYNNKNQGNSYPVCVTVKNVEKDDNDKCIIRYTKENETELIYSLQNVNKTLYESNEFPDCNLIMTKIQLFKDYLDISNKLKAHCEKEQFYNEPFTCKNDELRKSWYYYNHPEEYLLYKDEQEIIDYLIQQNYPTHISNETEQEDKKDNSSGFLNNKYFLILLLLFI